MKEMKLFKIQRDYGFYCETCNRFMTHCCACGKYICDCTGWEGGYEYVYWCLECYAKPVRERYK